MGYGKLGLHDEGGTSRSPSSNVGRRVVPDPDGQRVTFLPELSYRHVFRKHANLCNSDYSLTIREVKVERHLT